MNRSGIEVALGGAWREHRRFLLEVALRMLGDLAEAEDVVQESFIRLMRTNVDEIEDVRAWLLTVVSRLCLDQLRSARRQRQRPFEGEGDAPAPVDRVASAAVDPADRVTLDDSVRVALQVMLTRLTPAERTAFVLHDVFQLAFDDVAGIVGRSPEACRQLASRARRNLRSDAASARVGVGSGEQRKAVEAFVSAATTGDLDGLVSVLDPDVAGEADIGGGRRGGFARGRDRIARGALRFIGPESGVTLLSLPIGPDPTLVGLRDGEVVVVLTLSVRAGRVEHIHALADPAALAEITAALYG
jgi:RNA polymerase sigma-70 factor (ECF subfamily)